MRRTRTPIPPIFQGPGLRNTQWKWTVTMKIGPSGYCQEMHVTATRSHPSGDLVGTASGVVPAFVDVHEVMELLATEAMLVASQPNLFGTPPERRIDVSTSF